MRRPPRTPPGYRARTQLKETAMSDPIEATNEQVMENPVARLERALANLAITLDNGPCRTHRKKEPHLLPHGRFPLVSLVVPGDPSVILEAIKAGKVEESVHVLTSLVFDLWLRLEQMYCAIRSFAEKADPEFAAMVAVHAELLDHYEAVEPVRWDQRALYASEILHSLLKDTEEEHRALVAELASRAPEGTVEKIHRSLPRPGHTGALDAAEARLALAGCGDGGTRTFLAPLDVEVAADARRAADQKLVEIFLRVPNTDFTDLWVDDRPVLLSFEGKARVLAAPGLHRMHWRGIAAPNQEYEIGITAPSEAAFEQKRNATEEGIVDGRRPFVVEP
jgi:hypothetical protein